MCSIKIVASSEDWTFDPWFTRPMLYHWAKEALLSSKRSHWKNLIPELYKIYIWNYLRVYCIWNIKSKFCNILYRVLLQGATYKYGSFLKKSLRFRIEISPDTCMIEMSVFVLFYRSWSNLIAKTKKIKYI